MRPTPFQAYVRIRSAATSSAPTASCRASAARSRAGRREHIARRGPAAGRRGLQGDHARSARRSTATSYDRRRRPTHRARRPARLHPRHAGHRADQVRHQLPEGHDRRPARRRARPAEGVHVPARAGPARLRRGAEADEAAVHGRVLPRDAGTLPRDACPAWPCQQRLHRRLLRRDRGVVRDDVRPGRASRGSRTASSSSTARGPAPRPTSCTPTTCPRRSRSAATTTCWPIRTPASLADHRRWIGQTVEVLVEGPSKTREARRRPMQLTGRTMTDHIVVFDGPARLAGNTVPVLVTEASPFTLYGDVITGEFIGATETCCDAPAESPSRIALPIL